jgi:S1-C subfamily serine protease
VDLLDWVLIGLLVLAAFTGFRRGALLQLFTYAGLLAGLVLGAVLAPRFAGLAEDRFTQSLIALGSFFAIAGIGDAVGWIIGSRIWIAARRSRFGPLDSATGVAVGLAAVLLATWFIGFNLANGPFPQVAREVRGSVIVRGINDVLPRPPSVLAEIRNFLNRFGFPEVFAGLPPAPAGPVKAPSKAQASKAFHAVARSTVQVVGAACGHVQEGSGFVVSPSYVVTNAHVVAGMGSPRVQEQSGGSQPGVPVLFDPKIDVAVLRVQHQPGPVLRLSKGEVGRGAKGAVVGYPGGGDLAGSAAAVLRVLNAVGRDIYGDSTVTRDVYEMQSIVRPGNSGGPFALVNGRVAGLVFAASTTDPKVGYAITSTEISSDVRKGTHRTNRVSTGPCVR